MKLCCLICEQPIKASDETLRVESGGVHHRICRDLVAASLAAELEVYLGSRPDLYERLPNGNYRALASRA